MEPQSPGAGPNPAQNEGDPTDSPVSASYDASGPNSDDFSPKNHIWANGTWWSSDRRFWWDGACWQGGPYRVIQESPQPSLPPSDWAAIGVQIGGATVVALPILEAIGVFSALGSCSGSGFANLVLIATTIALAAGGAGTLTLASKSTSGSPQRATARTLGIVAIVMAAVSVPINLFLVLLSGFCAVG